MYRRMLESFRQGEERRSGVNGDAADDLRNQDSVVFQRRSTTNDWSSLEQRYILYIVHVDNIYFSI